MQDIGTMPMLGESLTIGIPVRIDSKERKANLSAVVKHLSALQCRIIVLEADAHTNTDNIGSIDNVDYVYVEDTNTVFHRTRYINQLLLMSQTEIVAIWDTDVLVDYCQIFEALQEIRLGATIAYPYDGRFIMLSEELSTQTRRKLDFDYLRNLRMSTNSGICSVAVRMNVLQAGDRKMPSACTVSSFSVIGLVVYLLVNFFIYTIHVVAIPHTSQRMMPGT